MKMECNYRFSRFLKIIRDNMKIFYMFFPPCQAHSPFSFVLATVGLQFPKNHQHRGFAEGSDV